MICFAKNIGIYHFFMFFFVFSPVYDSGNNSVRQIIPKMSSLINKLREFTSAEKY